MAAFHRASGGGVEHGYRRAAVHGEQTSSSSASSRATMHEGRRAPLFIAEQLSTT
ncbi:hypothetical protein Dimus_035616, partial [Dionaea muscipula]